MTHPLGQPAQAAPACQHILPLGVEPRLVLPNQGSIASAQRSCLCELSEARGRSGQRSWGAEVMGGRGRGWQWEGGSDRST